jgi:antitoxin PrlF
MKVEAVISSKGQVTLPQEVRQRLGLKQGDRVEFVLERGKTVMRPARKEVNPFAAFVGSLGSFKTEVEVNAWVAGLRDDDAER